MQEAFENEKESMKDGCDGRRDGQTAKCFIAKPASAPTVLVPTAQPLGCSQTTAIVSAGSRGRARGRRCRRGRALGRA